MAIWTVYLSLCLLMALSASVEANPVGGCGGCLSGWSAFGCRCFRFFNNAHTWIDAEHICLGHDGHLASVHSLEEYTFIQNLIKSATNTRTRAWIGGSDAGHAHTDVKIQSMHLNNGDEQNIQLGKEGHWLWRDGSNMNFKWWTSGEPNNKRGNEHCLEMNDSYGYWNDDACYKKKPFVCVK